MSKRRDSKEKASICNECMSYLWWENGIPVASYRQNGKVMIYKIKLLGQEEDNELIDQG